MLTKSQFDLLASVASHNHQHGKSAPEPDQPRSFDADPALVTDLAEQGLVARHADGLTLTSAGLEALAPYRVDNAVIMAAGVSSRFVPISYEQPKGLLTVRGEVLIERQIKQLKAAGVTDITVVVGYLAEKFAYLADKLSVSVVVNPDYLTRNNNSTLWHVRDKLANTYVCSSDNYFARNVFEPYVLSAYYATVHADGPTSEWCVETDAQDRITHVTIGGLNAWYMMGHVYFDRAFSQRFTQVLEEDYDKPETAGKLWESVYLDHLGELDMRARRYEPGVIYEFDSLADLCAFDPEFIDNVQSPALTAITQALGCKRSDIHGIKPASRTLADRSFTFTVMGRSYLYQPPSINNGSERPTITPHADTA